MKVIPIFPTLSSRRTVQGLFSIAFSPGFHTTGVFYASYSPPKRVSGQTTLGHRWSRAAFAGLRRKAYVELPTLCSRSESSRIVDNPLSNEPGQEHNEAKETYLHSEHDTCSSRERQPRTRHMICLPETPQGSAGWLPISGVAVPYNSLREV